MKKQTMSVGKLLESIVVAVSCEDGIDHINLVDTNEGEVITAKSSVELIVETTKAGWSMDWRVDVITATRYGNYFTVVFDPLAESRELGAPPTDAAGSKEMAEAIDDRRAAVKETEALEGRLKELRQQLVHCRQMFGCYV